MAGSSEAGCSAGWVWEGNGNAGSWELQQVGLKQPVFAAATFSTLLRAEQSPLCCHHISRVCELSRCKDAFAGTTVKVHLTFVLNDHSSLVCP